ncbi:MAG: hypothetical protein WBO00_03655 [Steroidobacteraceae bacterium]
MSSHFNANFHGNPGRHGLPAIQGMIGLFDAATIAICGCGIQGRANGRKLSLTGSE